VCKGQHGLQEPVLKIDVRSHPLPHPRERVYEALTDPSVLSGLMPGVEKFEAAGSDTYDVVVKLGVGAVRGAYTGRVELFEQNPPAAYSLRGEAKGKPGWARGEAKFSIDTEDAASIVSVSADAQIGGTIAGVGQRMMEGVGKSMAREFFTALDKHLEGTGKSVGQVRFGFRVLLGMIRDFFARLFGRGA
jgi:carbon monoxide dehydrogenase subunit G